MKKWRIFGQVNVGIKRLPLYMQNIAFGRQKGILLSLREDSNSLTQGENIALRNRSKQVELDLQQFPILGVYYKKASFDRNFREY